MLSLAFVTGTEPGKWLRRYAEGTPHGIDARATDDPLGELADGTCDLALARLPDARVGESHHVVRLYDETPGVAVPKDSVYAEVAEAVDAAELADEIVNFTYAEGADTDELRGALQVVAANVGIAFAPLPLLKALSKKQVVPLELRGEGTHATSIGLVWKRADDCDAIQDFVGVAKGRTPNSSRGTTPAPKKAPRPAQKKAPAKRKPARRRRG
ncbi:LysR substrate-binding domain-containing protein [Corynebacterium sp.]|uniref:LysR substrate-binding domain-containing protein n=1 Tax=Corynebacterium sp. TaxID=1720 RepID=UPI002A91405E|nr:LysR substrate-binding domain-containing protein [Corynebacterium sp.]MDY5784888.1 LysR family transcriptional regulator [Corynebacterium sp.]